MSDFVNTIDALGDEATVDSIIDGSIVEFLDDNIISLGDGAFRECGKLIKVDMRELKNIGRHSLFNCFKLSSVNFPKVETIGTQALLNCSSLKTIKLPSIINLLSANLAWNGLVTVDLHVCTSMANTVISQTVQNLIIRSSTKCEFTQTSLYINNNPSAVVRLFVPSSLIESYKADANLAPYVDRIFPLEDYTVDGTITGDFVAPN